MKRSNVLIVAAVPPRLGAPVPHNGPLRAAEFFAGIGLMGSAIKQAGGEIVFANDIEPFKQMLYEANFDAEPFWLGDVRDVDGDQVPDVELATASFPCTDLSLAGQRRGLSGDHSGMFWEFARVLEEMDGRRPPVVLLENVPSFATSKGGKDLAEAISRLNDLGYSCDIIAIDARNFVPQSRQRLFIVGVERPELLPRHAEPSEALVGPVSALRPPWLMRFLSRHADLDLHMLELADPPESTASLDDIVIKLPADDERWWESVRVSRFVESLSDINDTRLNDLVSGDAVHWATAYRRTRSGRAVWEIRGDCLAGCLRTARGGSSKQALVEAGRGELRIRWMTAEEYARLQGVQEFAIPDGVTDSQALFGFGDAVCVPAVKWLVEQYVAPTVRRLSQTVPDEQ